MAEGLRPHHHQYFEYRSRQYYDKKQECIVKKVEYMCMICGNIKHETYYSYVPPKHKDKSKVLSINRNKHK